VPGDEEVIPGTEVGDWLEKKIFTNNRPSARFARFALLINPLHHHFPIGSSILDRRISMTQKRFHLPHQASDQSFAACDLSHRDSGTKLHTSASLDRSY